MRPLTERQQQVLQAIKDHMTEEGFAPSVREIGERLGLRSSCTVQRHLEALIDKGYLKRDGSKARTLEVVGFDPSTTPMTRVPLVGRVAAGAPALAEEDIEDFIPLGQDLVGDGDTFALRVNGESMIDAGLHDGDLVIVRKQVHADDGDIVVALVDGEDATVKRFFREDGRIKLQPENPTMEPFYPEDVAILGRVVLSLRRF